MLLAAIIVLTPVYLSLTKYISPGARGGGAETVRHSNIIGRRSVLRELVFLRREPVESLFYWRLIIYCREKRKNRRRIRRTLHNGDSPCLV